MLLLTTKEKIISQQKSCNVCHKEFNDDNDDQNYQKVGDHCHHTGKYRDATYNIYNLPYKTPKGIPAVLHNISNYHYQFIITVGRRI